MEERLICLMYHIGKNKLILRNVSHKTHIMLNDLSVIKMITSRKVDIDTNNGIYVILHKKYPNGISKPNNVTGIKKIIDEYHIN